MSPDPNCKPTPEEMRQGGMVAVVVTAVLAFVAIFNIVIVWTT